MALEVCSCRFRIMARQLVDGQDLLPKKTGTAKNRLSSSPIAQRLPDLLPFATDGCSQLPKLSLQFCGTNLEAARLHVPGGRTLPGSLWRATHQVPVAGANRRTVGMSCMSFLSRAFRDLRYDTTIGH